MLLVMLVIIMPADDLNVVSNFVQQFGCMSPLNKAYLTNLRIQVHTVLI